MPIFLLYLMLPLTHYRKLEKLFYFYLLADFLQGFHTYVPIPLLPKRHYLIGGIQKEKLEKQMSNKRALRP